MSIKAVVKKMISKTAIIMSKPISKHHRPTILLIASGSSNWIGGLYYIKNVAFQLAQNKDFTSRYDVVINIDNAETRQIFDGLPGTVKIRYGRIKSPRFERYSLISFCLNHNVVCCYPRGICDFVPSANWIADFQHNHLKEMFSLEEQNDRTQYFQGLADSSKPLMLSSFDAADDFNTFYNTTNTKYYVMHFVSFIEPEVKALTSDYIEQILGKFCLSDKRFVLISNQFWKHKNHLVVLQAIKYLAENNQTEDFQFVFTGSPKDYRNPDYYNSILDYVNDESVKPHISILGFIDRKEQLALMKCSQYIIQPSLFEGWGTVVEDAKVLDKNILLSDIPVHHEQMNKKTMLFNPHDYLDLASKITTMNSVTPDDDVDYGLRNMYAQAIEYSASFEQMLSDMVQSK